MEILTGKIFSWTEYITGHLTMLDGSWSGLNQYTGPTEYISGTLTMLDGEFTEAYQIPIEEVSLIASIDLGIRYNLIVYPNYPIEELEMGVTIDSGSVA